MTIQQIKEKLEKIVEISDYAVLVPVGGQYNYEYDHSLDLAAAVLKTRKELRKLIKEINQQT